MSLKDTIRSKMYECMKENNKADKAVYSMLVDYILMMILLELFKSR